MTSDRIGERLGDVLARVSELDTDWQGVLVGAAIAVLVGVFGVTIPW